MKSKHELVLACLQRHVEREKSMSVVKLQLRLWFESRMEYLEAEYDKALHEAGPGFYEGLWTLRPQLIQRYYPPADGGYRPPDRAPKTKLLPAVGSSFVHVQSQPREEYNI